MHHDGIAFFAGIGESGIKPLILRIDRLRAAVANTGINANTLRIDVDAGTQTRRLRFAPPPAGAKPPAASWQGESNAQWTKTAGNEGGSSLRVVTSNLRAGYLRKNGVPAELHIYEKGPHGVGLAWSDAVLGTWPARLADWLRNR